MVQARGKEKESAPCSPQKDTGPGPGNGMQQRQEEFSQGWCWQGGVAGGWWREGRTQSGKVLSQSGGKCLCQDSRGRCLGGEGRNVCTGDLRGTVGRGSPGLQPTPSSSPETAERWLSTRCGEGSFPAGLPGKAFAEPEGTHTGFWPGIKHLLCIGHLYLVFVFTKMGLYHTVLYNMLFFLKSTQNVDSALGFGFVCVCVIV